MQEVYVVHTDNWFDYKWLGWWSWTGKILLFLTVHASTHPLAKAFPLGCDEFPAGNTTARERSSMWISRVAHNSCLDRRIDSPACAAFIRYSGNTTINKAGSLMVYLAVANRYAWYASFQTDGDWRIDGEREIARRELLSFLETGPPESKWTKRTPSPENRTLPKSPAVPKLHRDRHRRRQSPIRLNHQTDRNATHVQTIHPDHRRRPGRNGGGHETGGIGLPGGHYELAAAETVA